MTLDAVGNPLRSAYQEILDEEEALKDPGINVLSIYHRIMALGESS